MTKLYGILLIASLVAVSGLIAYVGDIVGRRMGRKRLSLFGMRPRHTAIAISVIAGMVITFFTLTVAALVSNDVKAGLFQVVEMRLTQAQLNRDIRDLSRHAAELERQRQQAERQVAQSRRKLADTEKLLRATGAELKRQEAKVASARERLAQAERKLAASSSQLAAASAQVRKAQEAFARQHEAYNALTQLKERLEGEVQRASRALRLATQAAEIGRSAPVLVGAGQPLAAEVVEGNRSPGEIAVQLEAMVEKVERQARAIGAGADPASGAALIVRRLVVDEQTKTVTVYSSAQVVAAVAEQVHEDGGSVIARLTALYNTIAGEPVYADFQLFRNRLVYRKGDTLAETIVDGRLSEPALMAALVGLLRDEVGAKARERNVMPRIPPLGSEPYGYGRGSVGEMSYEDLFANIGILRHIAGPARVRALAAEETWTSGPLHVRFEITPVSD